MFTWQNAVRLICTFGFLYGALALVANSMGVIKGVNPMWFVQAFGFLFGSPAVFGLTFLDHLTFPKILKLPTAETKVEPLKQVSLVPSKLEETDSKNIYYLSARFRSFGDDEALKLLKHLERRLWCQHHGVTNEKTIVESKSSTSTNAS